jgi:hypothetical protein
MELVNYINDTALMDGVKLIDSDLSERKKHMKYILLFVTHQFLFLL